ncbi:MAG: DUF1559 domain-containing protein [Planctomycetes bacterium]|nr:DUF1559 domain-containing protein [Planctomycetota bacterium]
MIREEQLGDQLVGRVHITQADDETAIGRVLVTRRVLKLNRYEADQVQPGDKVARVRRDELLPLDSPADAAREASSNNLKQLMLALHYYHDTHKRFPPAVILGKDGRGGPPHSWRVELLPFLDQQALYDEYRFDEPWNSEHNRSLLAKMPEVYRSPLDAQDSTNASYFALVTPGLDAAEGAKPGAPMIDIGPGGAAGGVLLGGLPDANPGWSRGTMFSNPRGTRISEIHDGTSNTIALVEARRSIPWTRPHDISYVADQALPVLGGWFPEGWHAGFADGSVQFLSADTDETTLRALFTIGGGENVRPHLLEPKPAERQ